MGATSSAEAAPIFIMSFDRPDYLERVLDSLNSQIGCDIGRRRVFLFQDGAVNPFSNKRHATDLAIAQCVEIFTSKFPEGEVRQAPGNLGVGLNFDRAEKFGFEELAADAVIFLEDDLVLGKYYIRILDTMISQFQKDDRVGYVAAYGDHTKSLEAQGKNESRVISLGHNWGFALYKRQWLRMREKLLQYVEIIEGCDYRDRDVARIRKLFASWGYGSPAISQDAAKTIACCANDVIKINTYVCNATYIGEKGLHMNNQLFAQRGYANTIVYPKLMRKLDDLDDHTYRLILRDQRDWARSSLPGKAIGGDGAEEDQGAERLGPLEGASAAELHEIIITAAYRALLGRDPDQDGFKNYKEFFVGSSLANAIQGTIAGLLASPEFANRRTPS